MINITFYHDCLTIGNVTQEYIGIENYLILNDIEFIFSDNEFVVLNPSYLTVRELLSCYECTMHSEERSWQHA